MDSSPKIIINYLLFLDCSKIIKRSEIDCTASVFFRRNRIIKTTQMIDINTILFHAPKILSANSPIHLTTPYTGFQSTYAPSNGISCFYQ